MAAIFFSNTCIFGYSEMQFSLLDFGDQFKEILESTIQEIYIISPFIGLKTASQLAEWLKENPTVICRIITRFYREDFIQNVSSLQGLEELYKAGAGLYAVQGLHTKFFGKFYLK